MRPEIDDLRLMRPEIDDRLVAAGNSLVRAQYSLFFVIMGNMPRRVNWCDIVRARDLSEIIHLIIGLLVSGIMCLVIYTRQFCGNYYLVRA